MKITEALLAEHVVFHHLFDYLERAAPRCRTLAEVRSLAALLEATLHAHSDTEEELFIEPLEHYLEQIGQSDTFHEEHVEIDANLRRAQSARRVGDARRLLLAAVVSSRKHFDKEERLIFPLAERALKSKTLTELGDAWMKRRNAAVR
jgi:hemerythrin-like domain-containing protein